MASLYEAIERGVKQAFANPVDALGGRSVNQLLHEFRDGEIVPVVRCRDCKHCFSCENDPMTPYDGETDWYCAEFDVDWHVLTLDPNRFYCANGERREQDAERSANQ